MTELCCELATAHGGDAALAGEMIRVAAAHGAHTVKIQVYDADRLNPNDPQYNWLRKSALNQAAIRWLMDVAAENRVGFLATPFDHASFDMLREMGHTRFKIASTQANDFVPLHDEAYVVSYPWGRLPDRDTLSGVLPVTAIPLYPTPLECVRQATLLYGWSDHTVGLSACFRAIAREVRYLEVHVTMAGAREMPWDKTPEQVRILRTFIDDAETMATGVSQVFRERWRG